ncbi:MAG: hypothetical protein SF123_11095 [Chloroflexota bacterium]|nr:hypothetical protein [Chloroflexota bacterium]
MAELIIRSERLASRLLKVAQREQRSVEEMLEQWLEEHDTEFGEMPASGSSEALLASALAAGIESSGEVDTSARSREILETEYAEYLQRRLDER